MSNVALGSPAKRERVERHLSRQRGAGVRNLATNFGFSFAVSGAATLVSDRAKEVPPRKRRKSTHIKSGNDVGESKDSRNCPGGGSAVAVAVAKPKDWRLLGALKGQEVVVLREDEGETFKKAGRPKKKTVLCGERDTVSVAAQVPVSIPERRPRRHAATSALAKVAEGFAEEATEIDKKRRDPEPEKAPRRGRTKTAFTATAQAVVPKVPGDMNAETASRQSPALEIVPQEDSTQNTKIRTAKKGIKPAKRDYESLGSSIKRVPLAETDANVPLSPKKSSTSTTQDPEVSWLTTSTPKKTKLKSTKTHAVRATRKTTCFPVRPDVSKNAEEATLQDTDAQDKQEVTLSSSRQHIRSKVRQGTADVNSPCDGTGIKAERFIKSADSHSKQMPAKNVEDDQQPCIASTNDITSSAPRSNDKASRESKVVGSARQPKGSKKPVLESDDSDRTVEHRVAKHTKHPAKKAQRRERPPEAKAHLPDDDDVARITAPLVTKSRPRARPVTTEKRVSDEKRDANSLERLPTESRFGRQPAKTIPLLPGEKDVAESLTKSKALARLAESRAISPDEEDVDWLFESVKRRSIPTRQSKRRPTAITTRRAKLPDIDLDEMLSNVASWAPKQR